ncbi:MAG: hypothetical protein ACFHHU_14625 [Porticoccaceae bacterium]
MNSIKALILLGIYTSFVGCSSGVPPDQAIETEGAKEPSSQTYQKPGAAVRFDHNYSGQTEPGEMENIVLTFAEAYEAGTMSISVDADQGLVYELASPQVFDLQSADSHQLEVSLSAPSEGRYYLRIFAEVLLPDGQMDRRVFGLALQVGAPQDKAISSDKKTDTDFRGGELILLPAE